MLAAYPHNGSSGIASFKIFCKARLAARPLFESKGYCATARSGSSPSFFAASPDKISVLAELTISPRRRHSRSKFLMSTRVSWRRCARRPCLANSGARRPPSLRQPAGGRGSRGHATHSVPAAARGHLNSDQCHGAESRRPLSGSNSLRYLLRVAHSLPIELTDHVTDVWGLLARNDERNQNCFDSLDRVIPCI
jgi:hypothetical protein